MNSLRMSMYRLKRGSQKVAKRLLYHPALGPLLLRETVRVEEGLGKYVGDLKVLSPAQRVEFATASDAAFLKICKYYNDGSFLRPDIFTCVLPGARLHVGTGLVCTADFKAVTDSVMEYRLPYCRAFGRYKPMRVRKVKGIGTTIHNVFGANHWHWLVDSLPRIYSLVRAGLKERVTLLMPDALTRVQRESLACVLPPHFEAQFLPASTWVQPDHLILPSYVSGRANGYLPAEYTAYLRDRIFSNLGLPADHVMKERIFISRAKAARRRLANEGQVAALLARFGFKSVALEDLSFRQQAELFHGAEFVVAPNGAGLGNILFSGRIKVLVLYPDRPPNTYFLTQANALGQEHFFLTDSKPDEYCDFEIDLSALESILRNQWGIHPAAGR